jgi:hypothetical protein
MRRCTVIEDDAVGSNEALRELCERAYADSTPLRIDSTP